jgi:hypothetical protein
MARKKTWGTPGGRLRHYVFPRPWLPRLLLGLALTAVVSGVFVLLQLGGGFVSALREPLMPGALADKHSTIASCEACHATGRGVPDFRCQRCHDESGPGRMTQVAHAGRHIPRQANVRASEGTAENPGCVGCHVEHRGRKASLAVVSDHECADCHGVARETAEGPRPRISSFQDHPELAVVLADRKAAASGGRVQQVTGIFFSHAVHLKAVGQELGGAAAEVRLCQECHKLEGAAGASGHREFAPIAFDADCLSCHSDHLAAEPAPAAELVVQAEGAVAPFTCDPKVFTCGDAVVKNAVAHRDPWILLNLRKLRRELYPEEHAREYGDLLTRAAGLRRRLFLAQPLAVLAADDLKPRRDAFADEMAQLDARIQARAAVASDASGGRARLEEVAAAAAAAQSPDLAALRAQIDALPAKTGGDPDGAASGGEFEERRDELLRLLDAAASAEGADPRRRAQAAYLRLRVFALAPGEPALDALRRARRQREEDIRRVEDEMALRRSGISALGNPGSALRDVEAALSDIQGRLQELKAIESFPEARPGDRPRKEAALRALAGEDDVSGCAKCHDIRKGTLAPVTASRRVLTLADFRHEPHLNATPPDPSLWRRLTGRATPASAASSCASCHPGVAKSAVSTDLHLEPIASCRECHRPRAQRQDCQLCHRYHPPSRL